MLRFLTNIFLPDITSVAKSIQNEKFLVVLQYQIPFYVFFARTFPSHTKLIQNLPSIFLSSCFQLCIKLFFSFKNWKMKILFLQSETVDFGSSCWISTVQYNAVKYLFSARHMIFLPYLLAFLQTLILQKSREGISSKEVSYLKV